jgi:hypothetical protein
LSGTDDIEGKAKRAVQQQRPYRREAIAQSVEERIGQRRHRDSHRQNTQRCGQDVEFFDDRHQPGEQDGRGEQRLPSPGMHGIGYQRDDSQNRKENGHGNAEPLIVEQPVGKHG